MLLTYPEEVEAAIAAAAKEIEDEENRNFLIENGYKVAQHELENNYDGTFTLKPINSKADFSQRIAGRHPTRKHLVYCIKAAYGIDTHL